MRDSSRLVKNFRTPFAGGASAIGFVASMTGFRARFAAPAAPSAAAASLGILGPPVRQLGLSARAHHHLVTMLQETPSERLRHVTGSQDSDFHDVLPS